ncbi:hypothetical protein AJ88_34065 [Mesorhizobium amorphae CCBAU 01583]|nr:hypothetical protein AJ88_34065 [Mesorhizobium amorphae CCBAU 01583]
MVLRSQSQAEYSPKNIGHFGLNLKRYAHFTSPIRRYADLIVHRGLIAALDLGAGGLTQNEADRLEDVSVLISGTERRAMAAERDTVDRLVAAYLAERIDDRFDARISASPNRDYLSNCRSTARMALSRCQVWTAITISTTKPLDRCSESAPARVISLPTASRFAWSRWRRWPARCVSRC